MCFIPLVGTMRSGDLHNCTQYDISLKGASRLHTKVWAACYLEDSHTQY